MNLKNKTENIYFYEISIKLLNFNHKRLVGSGEKELNTIINMKEMKVRLVSFNKLPVLKKGQ